jgi:FkbM family methyltransferase
MHTGAESGRLSMIRETAKSLSAPNRVRLLAFCLFSALEKLSAKRIVFPPVRIAHGGKRFEIRIGQGEFTSFFETNIRCVYQGLPAFAPGPSDTAIDVGANFGSASLQWSRTLTAGAIHAVEPHPTTYRRLVRHIRINGAGRTIRPYNVAFGSRDGMLPLFVTEAGSMAMKARSARYGGCRIEVPCLTLDSFVKKEQIDRIDLIKIDVEGFESDVLLGAAGALDMASRIVLEYHSASLRVQCEKLLTDAGFHLTVKAPLLFGQRNSEPVR